MHRLLMELLDHAKGQKKYGRVAETVRSAFEGIRESKYKEVLEKLKALKTHYEEKTSDANSKQRRQVLKEFRAMRDLHEHWKAIGYFRDFEDAVKKRPEIKGLKEGVGPFPNPTELFKTPEGAHDIFEAKALKKLNTTKTQHAYFELEQVIIPMLNEIRGLRQ